MQGNIPLTESDGASGDRLVLIHLEDASNSTQRISVENTLGCNLRRYLPHNTFLVRVSSWQVMLNISLVDAAEFSDFGMYVNQRRKLMSMPENEVLWAGDLQPHHKYLPSILQRRKHR